MCVWYMIILAQIGIEGEQLRDNGRGDDVTQRFGRESFAVQHVGHRADEYAQTQYRRN